MKPHLWKVERRIDYTDKSEYDFILNQSERSQPIPHSYYTKMWFHIPTYSKIGVSSLYEQFLQCEVGLFVLQPFLTF